MAGLYMQFYGSCGLTNAQAWTLQGTLKDLLSALSGQI